MTGIVRQHSVVGLGMPAQEAIEIARQVLAAEGYQSVAIGPTAATFVRDVRPSGVTIAAYACAIPTLGLSLFALMIRSQEQCTVTGETSRRGTALSLSGVVTTETLQELEAALRHGKPASVPPADDYAQSATPGRGASGQIPPSGQDSQYPSSDPFPYPAANPSGNVPRLGAQPASSSASAPSRSPFPQATPYGERSGYSGAAGYSESLPEAEPFQDAEEYAEAGQYADSGEYADAGPVTYSDSEQAQYPGPAPLLGHEPIPSPPPQPSPPPLPPAAVRALVDPEPQSTPVLPPTSRAEPLRRPRRASAFPESFPNSFGEVEFGEVERDLTVVGFPAIPPEPVSYAEAEPLEPRWVISLDDGRTIEVPEFALIGRDPEPAEDDPEAGLVSLIDPEMSVSKTHAAFGVDDEGLWFLDRFSTNGTSVQAPGDERVGLEPGVSTTVLPGSDVWIGRRHLSIELIE